MKYMTFKIPDMTGRPTSGLMLICLPGDKWYETVHRKNQEEIQNLIKKVLDSIPVPLVTEFSSGKMSILVVENTSETCICLLEGQHSGMEIEAIATACAKYGSEKYESMEDVPEELYEPEKEVTMEELLRLIEPSSENTEKGYTECYILPNLTALYQFKTMSGTVKEYNGTYYLFTDKMLDDFFNRAEDIPMCENVIPDVSLLYRG